ncbi:hypothetical protein LR48_Vigan349s000500 [Vigna angularis]|uniref:Uncharacterized protein n=1 Tax=Phaseolus angularis TaxID=3914 RepID=A0A0L9T9G7_PHAAN|nr:hypothetical protein LR48_Vigan349s000500 [Vigna angularis]
MHYEAKKDMAGRESWSTPLSSKLTAATRKQWWGTHTSRPHGEDCHGPSPVLKTEEKIEAWRAHSSSCHSREWGEEESTSIASISPLSSSSQINSRCSRESRSSRQSGEQDDKSRRHRHLQQNFGGVVTSVQQETQAAMQNLSDQIGQMATLAPEETADEHFEAQARINSNSDPGRPISSSTTFQIFKEVEVSIPQYDYAIHDYVVNNYAIDMYADDYIVAEHDFNFPSVHNENQFLPSYLNTSYPCTEHESEFVVDNVSEIKIDSCSEDVSKDQPITLGLGVIPLHEISAVPHCTNHVAGGTYKFDQHTPTVENKGADTDNSKINKHLLNPLSNNICCLDPAVEDISLLDQIWRMKQFFLKFSLLDPECFY